MQEAPTAKELLHVPTGENAMELLPFTAIKPKDNTADPLLVMVTTCGVGVSPGVVVKFRALGVTVT